MTDALVLFAAASAVPAVIGLAVRIRVDRPWPVAAMVGGATIGPLVAIAGHALVAAFAYVFFLGFADAARSLLHALRVDPTIAAVVTSPWVLVAMAEYTVVAPITEETGKYLGSRSARPATRADAFLAGVAAGVGFAIVENVAYAIAAAVWGGPWLAVVIVRATGAAVHPLATGLVALGSWDAGTGSRSAPRTVAAGVGVHALWNGTMVELLVIGTVAEATGASSPGAIASVAFAGILGVVMGIALWSATTSVATGRDPSRALRMGDARTLAGLIVVAASLLVPVSTLIFVFPAFRG
jgi:RsiW-degrading membrane proteinase PrsW (M82 family)